MHKKEKKIYKIKSILATKASLNHKWTNWRQIEIKNRETNELHSLKKLVSESLWKDHQNKKPFESINITMQLQFKIWKLDKRAAISKTRNYCQYIGRSRGFYRKLFMSRHILRKFARFGMLPGLTKERY